MNIAIITIGTGKYQTFLSPLINSINCRMLLEHEKRIFVFSDKEMIGHDVIKINHLPRPLTALLKFNYINSLSLEQYDLVYFIDADCLVKSEVGSEIFPERGQLSIVKHPWQKINCNEYESNPKSKAYVSESNGMHYFQSCFFGGYYEDFHNMSIELEKDVAEDLKNRIITRWFDESYLNRYCISHPPKQLSCGYAYPDWDIWHQTFNVDPKIIHYNYNSLF